MRSLRRTSWCTNLLRISQINPDIPETVRPLSPSPCCSLRRRQFISWNLASFICIRSPGANCVHVPPALSSRAPPFFACFSQTVSQKGYLVRWPQTFSRFRWHTASSSCDQSYLGDCPMSRRAHPSVSQSVFEQPNLAVLGCGRGLRPGFLDPHRVAGLQAVGTTKHVADARAAFPVNSVSCTYVALQKAHACTRQYGVQTLHARHPSRICACPGVVVGSVVASYTGVTTPQKHMFLFLAAQKR
ncbi:uncharacterized protein EV422DRAFT_44925 [Fimicolochytrium jonesii]|uniref:uncharacterized protein n=1 Tax=Fimicolochytrium jonesii TaxID=1396493 RepID=UPI0022FE428C|nr:uncharacterized protein EV422DRAFT_44925 [Fimicolochytrium jonesii]KAI8821500.1 hypothetical protein EV422DRAFT_44925 [Fimicolochytrium jonesii]